MRYRIVKTPEYEDWLQEEPLKSRVQIASRLEKIESEGHFGTNKDVDDGVWELNG